MRVFYDCEFLEDYRQIDLISIGMVRDDGKEFYAVSKEFNTLAVANHNWLMENVMTSIAHEEVTSHITGTGQPIKDLIITDPNAMTRREIRAGILAFVADIWPEFWAWYGAYDHVGLCQLFGPMINLPAGFPMFTNDIKQLVKQTKVTKEEMPVQPEGKHNALEDARFNIVRYNFLKEYMELKDLKRITGILDRAAGLPSKEESK